MFALGLQISSTKLQIVGISLVLLTSLFAFFRIFTFPQLQDESDTEKLWNAQWFRIHLLYSQLARSLYGSSLPILD